MEAAGNLNITDPDLYQNSLKLREWDHSENLDSFLGYNCLEIENELAKTNKFEKKTWLGLHPQVLQTPYSQIFHFLSILKKYSPQTVVDFGAAYGRVAFVMQSLIPDAQFIGYEVIEKRYLEAKRLFTLHNLDKSSMNCTDITQPNFEIPVADIYFVYDFSEPKHIRDLLSKLISQDHDRFFLVARGDGVRSIIQNRVPELWAAYDPIHDEEWSLYSHFIDLKTT